MVVRPTILATLLLLAGCTAPTRWREIERVDELGSVWRHFQQTASTAGFIPGPETDRGLRRYVSRWRSAGGVRLFRSARARLVAEFERSDSGEGWKIRFHVERQEVNDLGVSQRISESDWTAAGQDASTEELLLGMLRVRFGERLDIEPGGGIRD